MDSDDYDAALYDVSVKEDDCYYDYETLTRHNEPVKNITWKDVPFGLDDIVLHLDGGASVAWDKCKEEITAVKSNLSRITRSEVVSQSQIIDIFYSRDGYIYQALHEAIGIEYDRFCRFVSTLIVLHTLSLSTTRSYEMFPESFKNLLDQREFLDTIESLAVMNSGKRNTIHTEVTPLWKKLQKSFNEKARELVVVGRPDQQWHVIDDDKVHFENSKRESYENTTIKMTKHARDNRWGNVIHTMGIPCLQLLSCIKYEETGDTVTDVFKDMLANTFPGRMFNNRHILYFMKD